jgi:hypothetical protein
MAILAVLAFVSPALFGQNLGFSAALDLQATLLEGDSVKMKDDTLDSDKKMTTSAYRDFTLSAVGVSSNEDFGVRAAMERMDTWWGYVWWKPIEQFMLRLGRLDQDSTWAGADIADWGLHGNDFLVKPKFKGGGGYAGNVLPGGNGFFTANFFSDFVDPIDDTFFGVYGKPHDIGMQLSAYPLEGLAVNFGFNMAGEGPTPLDNPTLKNTYVDSLLAQIAYNIAGIGEAAVSYRNAPDDKRREIFVQWKMPIGMNMKFELGFNMGIVADSDKNQPLRFSLGYGWGSFDTGAMVINARAAAQIPLEEKENPRIGFDLLFSYNFMSFRAYVPVGIGIAFNSSTDDMEFYWNFSPYISKPFGEGIWFYAGVNLWNGSRFSSTRDPDTIKWAVPIGMRVELGGKV